MTIHDKIKAIQSKKDKITSLYEALSEFNGEIRYIDELGLSHWYFDKEDTKTMEELETILFSSLELLHREGNKLANDSIHNPANNI